MISEAENQRLTRVDAGTPMGDLLRHYWHPVAVATELRDTGCLPVRLLGEDLVVVRDSSGHLAVLERFCAHRGGDLAHGEVEDAGIRCTRHGWLYGLDGRCLDQPLEEYPFCHEIHLKTYEAELRGGLVWVYMGPRPAPPNPHWQPYDWDDALVQIAWSYLACNWLQCQEEAVELPLSAAPSLERMPVTQLEETEYGFRVQEPGTAGAEPRKLALWPNGVASGDERSYRLEWRVPVDNITTLIVVRFADRPASGAEPAAGRFFAWQAPIHDERGEVIRDHELNRTFAIWLSQGAIFDRTQEHLGPGDVGLRMLRRKFAAQMDLVSDGGLPKQVAAGDAPIDLPLRRKLLPASVRFPIAGQPPDARDAYERVVATWRKER